MTKTYTHHIKWFCLVLMAFMYQINYAQTELWGTASQGGDYGYGYLYRTDENGDNLHIMYSFDSIHGKAPAGDLVVFNGKIYGLTALGGQPVPVGTSAPTGGVLYEYDMRTDSLKVLYYFKSSNPEFPYENVSALWGLTMSSPGVFWGSAGFNSRSVFKFNANTGIMQHAFDVPNFIGGSAGVVQQNGLRGPLFKATDGFLYGSTHSFSQCPLGFPNAGSVIRINPTTNAFSLVYPYQCSTAEGWNPNGDFVQVGSSFYSTNEWGGLYGAGPTSPGNGVIYEYIPSTNTYIKRHDFDGSTGFRPNTGMTLASNGKLYGLTPGGGLTHTYYPYGQGVLYEFDPVTKEYAKKYEFSLDLYGTTIYGVGVIPNGATLLTASNGHLYGTTANGIFEYNISTGDVRPAARFTQIGSPGSLSLIETCRPPAYKYFTDSVFTLCEGSYFYFNLHNTNSTSVIWKHNGIVSASHTSPILEFDNITLADAGTWQCIMTNDCGTTKPFALHITVNPSSGSTVSSVLTPADTTLICPGTTITLNGNNAGVWNTGATSASITVSQPGSYQVMNNNACGVFYSNIVVIDTIATPDPGFIPLPSTYMCYGLPVTLTGNMNGGVWNNGDTSPTSTVVADTVTPHYIVLEHFCGTDTSNILLFPAGYFYESDPLPVAWATGPTHFCAGGSVVLTSNKPTSTVWPWTWAYFNEFGSYWMLSPTTDLTVTEPGFYVMQNNSYCAGTLYSDTIEVVVESAPPPVPSIFTPDLPNFCEGNSANLNANTPGYWNTGDTSLTITAHTSGTYFFTAENVCGTSVSAGITINVYPKPTVTWLQPVTDVCISAPPVNLTGQSPAGGYFSGTGVSSPNFNPAMAGPGVFTLTYLYYEPVHGCSNTVTQDITVTDVPVSPTIFNTLQPGADSIGICQGDSVLLLPLPALPGQWNTSQPDPVLYAKDGGVYFYTVINACGTAVSNEFTLTVDSPDITVLQNANELTAAPAAAYQWLDCNTGLPLAGENSQVFTATVDGLYAVVVTSTGSCSATSPCYLITGMAMTENKNEYHISIYPNPANDYIFIESKTEISKVTIMDITGQVLEVTGGQRINLSNISRGTYLLEIETENKKTQQRFIKL